MSGPSKRVLPVTRRSKTPPGRPPRGQKGSTKKPRKRYDQIIFRDWCKACGICHAFCPKKVIGRDKTGAPIIEKPYACIGCRFCELHCPDFAITIREAVTKETKKGA